MRSRDSDWIQVGKTRYSRRTLLKVSTRAGIGAAGLALVGCGGDDDDDDDEEEEQVTTAVAPEPTEEAPAPAPAVQERGDITVAVVVHGQAADPFWSVVKNGIDDAAEDMGVTANFQAPDTFDMVVMSQLIDAAVATNPDVFIISNPDPAALNRAIAGIVGADIPLISINSGSDVFDEIGALTHVGQTEFEAGLGAGKRMAAAGVTKGLCVNQEVGNVALDLRCEGFTQNIEAAGGSVDVLAVDLADPTDAQQRMENTLSGSDFDGVLTLGPTGAAPALKAFEELGLFGTVQLATFDLSPDVLQALVDGKMLFAIDQQQYLQGYLPIVFLVKFLETLAFPGGGNPVLTGPGFVTADNAAEVIELSKQGIR
ncbi:MAG: sugar ABC transporter substrate-binding protein [Dehalococcoidia bacterium]